MEDNKQPENKDKLNKSKLNKILTGILVAILLIVLGVLSYFTFFYKEDESIEEKDLAYTELIKQITDGEIEKIEMTVGSTTLKVKQKNIEEEKTVIIPNTQAFIELVQEKVAEGNNIELIQNPENIIISISEGILKLLPTLIMVALFVVVFKMQGIGEKGKVYDAETTKDRKSVV